MPARQLCAHKGCTKETYSKYGMCSKHSNAAAQKASREFRRIKEVSDYRRKKLDEEIEKFVDEILAGPPITSPVTLKRQQDKLDSVEHLMAARDKLGPL